MNAGSLLIVSPGLHTTVQDRGRWGHQSSGVPVSGAMDLFSHRLANALAGNVGDAATLEITLVGPEIEFDDERVVATAGADLSAHVDGQPAPHEHAFVVPRHARLRFGARVRGARAYLAVSGGIAVPPVLGSRSTHVPSRLGGHEGRALLRGDRIPLAPAAERPTRRLSGPGLSRRDQPWDPASGERAVTSDCPTVRVLPGPHADRFASDALDLLQQQPYAVSVNSNRMGYRLDGPAITHVRGADLISDATAHGSLQVPGAGLPLLLMADRQTTGGYPCLATVITADIPVAAQVAPGERLAFRVCDRAEAMTALIAAERAILAIEGRR